MCSSRFVFASFTYHFRNSMAVSNLRLSITKISLLNLSESLDPFERVACRLKWKQNKLWVKARDGASALQLPAMTHSSWLQDCLRHSQVEAVCLDYSISQLDLNRWLTACAESHKPVFLRLPTSAVLPECQSPTGWRLKRVADWLGALLLLIGLSPLWLWLSLWLLLSPGPLLEREWRVGRRGKLFQMLRFRTESRPRIYAMRPSGSSGLSPAIPLGHWIRRSRLNDLPQLLNVLNGEMSLVGPSPWEPAEALRHPDLPCLNILPGMTGIWQLHHRLPAPQMRHPDSPDWDYSRNWSLNQDLLLLTRATFRVLGRIALLKL